jgi:hypothetical protein
LGFLDKAKDKLEKDFEKALEGQTKLEIDVTVRGDSETARTKVTDALNSKDGVSIEKIIER